MKTTPILLFYSCIIIFYYCGMSNAGGVKKIGLKVPLPTDIEIITPDNDVIKEIAAFSGVWQGKWTTYDRDILLIVEEINSKEAKVIYCLGESSGLYKAPARCERNKAIVSLNNLQIEFVVRETRFYTFSMKKNLEQVKAITKTPLATVEIMMTKRKN